MILISAILDTVSSTCNEFLQYLGEIFSQFLHSESENWHSWHTWVLTCAHLALWPGGGLEGQTWGPAHARANKGSVTADTGHEAEGCLPASRFSPIFHIV